MGLTDGRRSDGDDLDRRIAAAKQMHAPHTIASHGEGAAENKGWASGIEFVGTVLVSAFIGWLIDKWVGTAPWVMIVFLVLGFVAGLRRAMVTSRQIDNSSNSKHGH
jgi:ATP synthase protein I